MHTNNVLHACIRRNHIAAWGLTRADQYCQRLFGGRVYVNHTVKFLSTTLLVAFQTGRDVQSVVSGLLWESG